MAADLFSKQGDVYSWIRSSNSDKLSWLNNLIQKFWPLIENYGKALVIKKMLKSIQEYHVLLRDFSLTDLHFGKQCPRIADINVIENDFVQRNKIVLDTKVVYHGECDFRISLDTVSATIHMSDIRFLGLLRIELNPLIGEFPFVDALSFAFIDIPTIEFDATGLVDVLNIPDLYTLLQGAITKCIGDFIVLPEKYIFKLSDDVDVSRLRFPLPKGVLRVHVINAEDLEDADPLPFGGESDPYVVIKVGRKSKFKTRTINDSNNPRWEETFDVMISDVEYGNVEFSVYDEDWSTADDFLGRATTSLKSVYEQGVVDENVSLLEADTGNLRLRLKWFDLSADPDDLKIAMTQGSSCAVLAIYIDKASSLLKIQKYDSNPYLKIKLPNGKSLMTKVVKNTSEPVWKENFEIFLAEIKDAQILFRVKDQKSRMNLGDFKFPVKDLLFAKDMTIEKPFTLRHLTNHAALHARLNLRLMIEKADLSSKSTHERFTVTRKASKKV